MEPMTTTADETENSAEETKDTTEDISTEDEELSEEDIEKALKGEVDEPEAEGDAEPKGDNSSAKDDDAAPSDAQLKQQLAQLKADRASDMKEMKVLQEQIARNNEILKEAGLIEDDPEAQAQARKAEIERQEDLSHLEEMMKLNPKYDDYDTVMTPENEEALIASLTDNFADQYRGEYSRKECELAVRDAIDAETNPFRFKYEAIKELQSIAKDAPKDKDDGKGKTLPPTKTQTKEAVTAPASVNDLGGGDEGTSYTAARLDEMSTEELEKVPEKIREAWLSGSIK